MVKLLSAYIYKTSVKGRGRVGGLPSALQQHDLHKKSTEVCISNRFSGKERSGIGDRGSRIGDQDRSQAKLKLFSTKQEQ